MLFSIICPAYNVDKYISDCIDSILNQSFNDWEMIIIDDGSIDKTCDVVSCSLSDCRISLYSITHSGQTFAREYGIKKAKGDYIVFLDSDDRLHKETLQTLYDCIIKHSFDIISFGMKYFVSSKEIFEIDVNSLESTTLFNNENLLKHYYGKNKTLSLCGNAIKRKLVIDGFDAVPHRLKTIRICEDFVTIFEIIRRCSSAIILNEAFYFYRRNPESVSHTQLPSDRFEITSAYEYVYGNYIEIRKTDCDITQDIKTFLSYLPVTLVINDNINKHKTFLSSRKMVLFKMFTLKNKWNSSLLKAIVFSMKYRLYILYLFLDSIYSKKYVKDKSLKNDLDK